jgi:mono/diheme cytochrome c family protein
MFVRYRHLLLIGFCVLAFHTKMPGAASAGMLDAIAQPPTAVAGFEARVKPFFEAHCIRCHGPKNSKGKITVHTLSASDLVDGRGLEHWENILEMLESGEMPPEDEPQPNQTERDAVARWIEDGLRAYVEKASNDYPATTARRLTNFEYENTMRDLLGVDLDLIDYLPKDPGKPYHFNNTAEFMRLGPEQVDRYLEVARRAMASAIVDPDKPETHKTRQEWDSGESHKGFAKSLKRNEIAIQTSRRGTPGQGMGVKDFPGTGEFRIRFQASAVFPNGATELPLRFVMGYNLNINSSTQQIAPVGVVHLRNSPASPRIYELRGRIENFPVQVGRVHRGKRRPDTLTITPQNIYDDGTLNDDNRFLYWPRQPDMPRAVVDWIEFEAPITDVWPPEHHTRILFDSPLRQSNPGRYVYEVLSHFMSRAYRRPATTEEVGQFVKIYGLLKAELGTIEVAMRETLAMVLVTPQFLLHTKADGGGVSHDLELASALSYFLWGSMPDKELLELAAAGDINDPAVIAKQVRRMLADPRSSDFVSNFTNQWLSLPKMKTVPINRDLFPRFLYYVEAGERAGTEKPYIPTIRDHMIDETVGFIAELVRRNASVINLVDSDFAMLNQPLAAHYGVEGVEGYRLRPVPIKPDHHLGGLLTHGSVLIGNGTGSAPHPIYRAVWLREAILGDEVKAPPAEVPALSDSAGDSADQALSIKDLLAKHRTKKSCKDCHVRLDPWGIPFERYNAIGKYQPLVPKEGSRVRGFDKKKDRDLIGYAKYLKTINTWEVQASSRVPHGPKVDGMSRLKAHLRRARKHDIAENVIRRLLAYGIGRELNYRDRNDVKKLLSQSKAGGFLLQDMIVSICQSSTFRRASNNK